MSDQSTFEKAERAKVQSLNLKIENVTDRLEYYRKDKLNDIFENTDSILQGLEYKVRQTALRSDPRKAAQKTSLISTQE